MVKHTQTICRRIADELFELVWPFVGLALKELSTWVQTAVRHIKYSMGCSRVGRHCFCYFPVQQLFYFYIAGGIDDYLSSILELCKEQNIATIFAMNRHNLGYTLKKKAPVSIVGIFNYDGAQVYLNWSVLKDKTRGVFKTMPYICCGTS